MVLDFAVDKVLSTIKSKAIKALEDEFFPPEEPDYNKIWKNIKDKVQVLCKDLISDEYATQLEMRLTGLKNDL